ncbi:SDR family NAD(P)-dependent oxidoreductase [Corynebacterium halotolerans]|uniref:SDR family NAD(P)-dependent oxidoreductase n=1 Tax=Corynebacterium halotolerans TaxID=225326 RepID=UPI003CF4F1D1
MSAVEGQGHRFVDRVALITGGARGQGLAHAHRLADEGASVYISDVLQDEGELAAESLRGKGLDVHFHFLDVSDPGSWDDMFSVIKTGHGKLDVLVNNAGIINVAPIEKESLEAWTRILNVNLTGAFLGIQTMLPLLREADAAAVVNTSSIFGPSGAAGYAAYASSKAGLLGLTKVAALELASEGIRVNALVPGGVSTELNALEPDGGVVPETPMGRRADVSELAAAVAYLASSDASFVTGTELVVDGGFMTR